MSNQHKYFEECLAYHCAPVLRKCKSANMFHISRSKIPNIDCLVHEYNEIFSSKQLFIRILQADKPRITIYLYSAEILESILEDPAIRSFLRQYKYPLNSISACLDHLDKRLNETKFPHEIGIFLGYPLQDVLGFINHEMCYYVGTWKVYNSNKVEYFKTLFNRFDDLRNEFINAIEQGVRIECLV